jgi:hypothetical protein
MPMTNSLNYRRKSSKVAGIFSRKWKSFSQKEEISIKYRRPM